MNDTTVFSKNETTGHRSAWKERRWLNSLPVIAEGKPFSSSESPSSYEWHAVYDTVYGNSLKSDSLQDTELNAKIDHFNQALLGSEEKRDLFKKVVTAWCRSVAEADTPEERQSLQTLGEQLHIWARYFSYHDHLLPLIHSDERYSNSLPTSVSNLEANKQFSPGDPLFNSLLQLQHRSEIDSQSLITLLQCLISAQAKTPQTTQALTYLWSTIDELLGGYLSFALADTPGGQQLWQISETLNQLNPLSFKATAQEVAFNEQCLCHLPEVNIYYKKQFQMLLQHHADFVVLTGIQSAMISWTPPENAQGFYLDQVKRATEVLNRTTSILPNVAEHKLQYLQKLLRLIKQWSAAEPANFMQGRGAELATELTELLGGTGYFQTLLNDAKARRSITSINTISTTGDSIRGESRSPLGNLRKNPHRFVSKNGLVDLWYAHHAIEPLESLPRHYAAWHEKELARSQSRAPLFTPTPYLKLDAQTLNHGAVFLTFHKFAGKLGPHSDAFSVRVQDPLSREDQQSLEVFRQKLLSLYTSNRSPRAIMASLANQQQLANRSFGYPTQDISEMLSTDDIAILDQQVRDIYVNRACEALLQIEHNMPEQALLSDALPLSHPILSELCDTFEQPQLSVYRLFNDCLQARRKIHYQALGIGANRNGDLDQSADTQQANIVRINHHLLASRFRDLCQHRQGPVEAKMNALRGLPIALESMAMGESALMPRVRQYRRDIEKALVDLLVEQWLNRPESGMANTRYKQFSRVLLETRHGLKEVWQPDPDGLYFYTEAWREQPQFDPVKLKRVPYILTAEGSVRPNGNTQSSDSISRQSICESYRRAGCIRGDWIYDTDLTVIGFQERHDGQYLLPDSIDIQNKDTLITLNPEEWLLGRGFVPKNLEKHFGFSSELCASFIQRMLTAAYHQIHSPLLAHAVERIGFYLVSDTFPYIDPEINALSQNSLLVGEYQAQISDISIQVEALMQSFSNRQEPSDASSVFAAIQQLQSQLNQLQADIQSRDDFDPDDSQQLDALATLLILYDRVEQWSGIQHQTPKEHWKLPASDQLAQRIKFYANHYAGELADRLDHPHKEMNIRNDITPEMQYKHFHQVHTNWINLGSRFIEFGASAMVSLNKTATTEADQGLNEQVNHALAVSGGALLVSSLLSVKLIHDAAGLIDPIVDTVRKPYRCARERLKQESERANRSLDDTAFDTSTPPPQSTARRAPLSMMDTLSYGTTGALEGASKGVWNLFYRGSGARTIVRHGQQMMRHYQSSLSDQEINAFVPATDLTNRKKNQKKLEKLFAENAS